MDKHLLNVDFPSTGRLKLTYLERLVTARRIVCDSVGAFGGVLNVDVSSRKLLMSCSSARQKYVTYLEDQYVNKLI